MQEEFKPKARTSDLVIQELADELLIYDTSRHRAHCLNAVAAKIWHSCTGTRTESEIAVNLGSAFSDEIIRVGVDELNRRQLLESTRTIPLTVEGRRQAIRAMGISAAVAIPVITSLVAPRSALASITCDCVTSATCAQKQPQCPSTTCNANGICAA